MESRKRGYQFLKIVFGQTPQLPLLYPRVFLFGLFLIVVIASQASGALYELTGKDVLYNTGIAFEVLSEYSQAYYSLTISFLGLFFLYFAYRIERIRAPLMIIVGGGVSNLLDRIFFGAVRDYISLYAWHGNVADICIALGCLWALSLMYTKQ